jgi:hypothetical protein
MIIIGVDFHPEFQQIASLDTNTGEFQEKRLLHPGGGGEVLPCSGSCGTKAACGYGSQWAHSLVRTTDWGVTV